MEYLLGMAEYHNAEWNQFDLILESPLVGQLEMLDLEPTNSWYQFNNFNCEKSNEMKQ